MLHRLFTPFVAAVVLTLLAAAGPVLAQDRNLPTQPFDVYVDLPTGFAYIKTPSGWKFIRKLSAAQLRELPPTTLTALLAPEAGAPDTGIRYAQPAPRTDLDLIGTPLRLAAAPR